MGHTIRIMDDNDAKKDLNVRGQAQDDSEQKNLVCCLEIFLVIF